jgi:hypothetical protein
MSHAMLFVVGFGCLLAALCIYLPLSYIVEQMKKKGAAKAKAEVQPKASAEPKPSAKRKKSLRRIIADSFWTLNERIREFFHTLVIWIGRRFRNLIVAIKNFQATRSAKRAAEKEAKKGAKKLATEAKKIIDQPTNQPAPKEPPKAENPILSYAGEVAVSAEQLKAAAASIKAAQGDLNAFFQSLLANYGKNPEINAFVEQMKVTANELYSADYTIGQVTAQVPQRLLEFKKAMQLIREAETNVLLARANHVAKLEDMFHNPRLYASHQPHRLGVSGVIEEAVLVQ